MASGIGMMTLYNLAEPFFGHSPMLQKLVWPMRPQTSQE